MNHKMKDGTIIKISEMGDLHLINTIKLLQRKAEVGLTIRSGGCGPCAEDMWYDEDTIMGNEALELLTYKVYVYEARRRGLSDV